jgi:hypothetical protein
MDNLLKSIGKPFSISVIDNFIIGIQETLSETLSVESYENTLSILKPILTVCVILLPIYIVYSLLHFIYKFLFRRRLKIRVLISVAFSFIFFYIAYVGYITFFLNQ